MRTFACSRLVTIFRKTRPPAAPPAPWELTWSTTAPAALNQLTVSSSSCLNKVTGSIDPSRINLEVKGATGAVEQVRVGGPSVLVIRGELSL